jgi:hypothetical protein
VGSVLIGVTGTPFAPSRYPGMNPITQFQTALFFALAVGLTVAPGVAQAADTTGCTPQEKSGQTLSQQLNRTQGVICPPDVDPAMKQPAPQTGDRPNVSPPGMPGGGQGVQPK